MRRGGRGFAALSVVGLLAAAVVAAAAPARGAGARSAARDYRLLQNWMAGSFSSYDQSTRDPSFRDIRLSIVDIWPGRAGGRWYYVEQALAGHEAAPERQWACRLTLKDDGRIESAVFTLPAPGRFIGAGRQPVGHRLAGLSPDSLTLRAGCAVFLRLKADRFVGGTEGSGCASEPSGAAYATSQVEVRADRMTTLDRGFAAGGRQVWGSEHGPYEFVRIPEAARRN